MSSNAPLLNIKVKDQEEIQSADGVSEYIQTQLTQNIGWLSQPGGAGTALSYLFGRFAELTFNRLNQVPDKNFLAFLNNGGIDLLPPRAATVDLTFTPAPDVTKVSVAAGTQVATAKTETQPEVIFETDRDLVVAPNTLTQGIAFDPLYYCDCTDNVIGKIQAAFEAFRGTKERQRVLYVGANTLLSFADDAERSGSKIEIVFSIEQSDCNVPPWQLTWQYYDEENTKWVDIYPKLDTTLGLIKSGSIEFDALPLIGEYTVDDGDKQWTDKWLRCTMTKLTDVNALPVISTISVRKQVTINAPDALPELGFYNNPTSGVYIPLDLNKEFYPLGSRPSRHDAFYIALDGALSKPGADVELSFDIAPFNLPTGITKDAMFSDVKLVWSYYDGEQWQKLGESSYEPTPTPPSEDAAFTDETNVFTNDGGLQPKKVTFTVPDEPDNDNDPKPPQLTAINEEEHYWLRVQLVSGFYGTEGEWNEANSSWIPEKLFPPLLKAVMVNYKQAQTQHSESNLDTCLGYTDFIYADYTASSASITQSFAPFSSLDKGPAFYVGFENAFPEDEWIQILVDVGTEQTSESRPPVIWQYWNGDWAALKVSDGTDDLSERGYIGFFAPADHKSSKLFGHKAYWLRLSYYETPIADASQSIPAVFTEDGEAKVTLNASRSKVVSGHKITRYIWRMKPTAKAGSNRVVLTSKDDVPFTLDASNSTSAGENIIKYIWRKKVFSQKPLSIANAGPDIAKRTHGNQYKNILVDVSASLPAGTTYYEINSKIEEKDNIIETYDLKPAEPPEKIVTQPPESPWLSGIRINIISATNAETIEAEVLGSSDDMPSQQFSLQNIPVLPGVKIYVREPDRPPEEELDTLYKGLRQQDPQAQALLAKGESAEGEGGVAEGVWVRWQEVSDFYSSGPADRHFTLDPIQGKVTFGDGKQGKIPHRGRDNIKANVYRTHDGISGNAAKNMVTVLRNPSGDLSNIKTVTNNEVAAGGTAAETLDEVKRRGPQALKHRNRAVTIEDFEWLVREASSEIAVVRCLPTRDPLGLPQPGWVTVVITPKSSKPKPVPSPGLLRVVQDYLQDRALVNLESARHIHVKGPEYIEAYVVVDVIAKQPEKAEETELKVLEKLEGFFHPLTGGPQAEGWELARHVFLSEVYSEIESVEGVDHAQKLRLYGSLQQYYLQLVFSEDLASQPLVPFDIPAGSQVSTFDERIKLILAEKLVAERTTGVTAIGVHGLKAGDSVEIIASDDKVIVEDLKVEAVIENLIRFTVPFDVPPDWDSPDSANSVVSLDGRVRLPLAGDGVQLDADKKISAVVIQGFNAGDEVSILVDGRRDSRLEFLLVSDVAYCSDRVFVPEGHVVYSGAHDVRMKLE